MKKTLLIILSITMIISVLPIGAITASSATGNTTEFAGGIGTENDPYIITSKEHLLNVKNHLSSYYKMVSNIEFTDDDYSSTGILSNGWNAIGSSTKPFTGYFDGNNHSIIGLKKSSTFSGVLYLGLFGCNEGTIVNTNVVDCDFNAVCTDPGHFGAYVGGIVAWNKGTIEHCSSSGTIYGTNAAGGIVGENYSGSITRSYNFCTVSSNEAGGIAGINDRSVSNCYNTGAISGSTAGGIVGEGWMPSYCYNVGIINSDYYCGGILGYFPSSYSGGADGSNCYYLDNVTSGVGYISRADLTIRLSSSQMTQKESFEKFDFATTWEYDTSNNYHYPILKDKIDYSSFFAGGDGTEANPFKISNVAELKNITKDKSAYYKLICNIIFTEDNYMEDGLFSAGWIPFSFSGLIDGGGYSIVNLRVSTPTAISYCYIPGLFSTNNGTIKNLTIEDARYSINAGVYNGGVVCAENNGIITNCHSKNCLVVFNSCNHFGGIVGDNKGTIQNCTSENTLTLDSKAGKIGGIASNNSGNIIGCTNRTVIISAGSDYSTTGGIVATNSGKIDQCRNLAAISTTSTYQNRSAYSGGIVGSMSAGEITECYNSGFIYVATNKYSSNAYAGGLIGYLSVGKVSNSYNIGNISASNNAYSGKSYVGGLLGYNKTIDDVVNCYSVCQVQGYSSEDVYVGIICGYSSVATIKNCYYVGSVSGAIGFGDATYIYGVSDKLLNSTTTFSNFDFTSIWEIRDDTYAYPQLINNPHVCNHVFSNIYSNNESNHWYSCDNKGCNIVDAKAQHTFDNVCDTTCNICQSLRETEPHKYDDACDESCNICGSIRTITHDYDDATCKAPKTCKVCGATSGTKLSHKSDSGTVTKKATCTATGTKIYKCTLCKATIKTETIAKVAHKYDAGKVTKAATCKATGVKTYTCSVCKETKTETIAKLTTHTYSNNCDKSCNVCGKTRTVGAHKYSNNCDTTCNYCNAKRTIKHTYSNSCDTTCNVCKAKRTIKHTYSNNCDTSCNVCKATRTITHSYKTTTTKATLTKNGSIVKKCTVCGKVASKSTIKYVKSFKLSTTTYTYDGKVKTPSVTVKDSAGKTLKKNTDYTVTYASGRKNVGTYKVTIKMKGKYSGTKTLTFKINPAKTMVSKLTAGKKSITVAITKKSTQVTGYQIQYGASKSFSKATTKTISSYKTTKYTLKSLSAKKTYYVRVRTYKKVGSATYYSGWSTYKYVKTK